MNVNAPRVLIVEDDENINNLLREALTKHGLNCTQAFSGTEGLIVFKNDKFDLVLLDLMMPGMDGQTLTQRIREVSKVPIIIVCFQQVSYIFIYFIGIVFKVNYIRKLKHFFLGIGSEVTDGHPFFTKGI